MAAIGDWDGLRIFLACARKTSLRAAAEELRVNHATINRAISGLEQALGTRVFERSVAGLTLTQPGETLLRHAEEMERQAHLVGIKLAGLDAQPSGVIRVSLPTSLTTTFIAPILAGFTESFPEIEVELIATNRISNLGKHEADVSIRVAHEVEDDVVGRRVVRFVVGAYASPAYLARHPNLEVGDGTGAHWVGWGGKRAWVKDTPFPNATVRHGLPEVFMQMAGAANGLGMVWVPCFLGDADKRLVRVPGVVPQPDRSIWVLLHGDLRSSARVRAFVDYTVAAIKKASSRYTG
ncbi:LysR family transcriptional regulator [Phaeovulum sp.]|uniref:LysR family transcriptional regulator n=1 Tax=Phaeovulum sp. TaxID=2934796 RepID=UPI00272F0510|nr:LysR family transcriptional regulator [Phaeovulum sp.]MDP1669376.1 LysR family transcriptional regulator [Phaeovulum sp.]MDZ4117661.1 LysR family transcriptional regulator [Phaeovulum sp.]